MTLLDPPRTANTLEIGFALEPGAARQCRPGGPCREVSDPEAPSLRGAQDQPAELAAGGGSPVDEAQGAGHEAPVMRPERSNRPRPTIIDQEILK